MRVVKKLNNNVVIALNEHSEEFIVVGKGLGFEKIPYFIPKDHVRIEKIYIAPKNMKAIELIERIPEKDMELTELLVKAGEAILKREMNANIYLTLSDHVTCAIERYQEHIKVQNPLQWEIKHLYPDEYRVGKQCLAIIEMERGYVLPDTEATFIALHFVNAQLMNGEMTETSTITKAISEILNIVKYHYHMDFDEDSINFTRFVTHIRYFIIRQMNHTTMGNTNEDLFNMIKLQYTDELDCVSKINKYLENNYGWNCSEDEMLYLVLHIQRLKSRQGE